MRPRTFARKVAWRLGWRPRRPVPAEPVAPGVLPKYLRPLRREDKFPPALRQPPTIPARDLELPGDELTLGVDQDGIARAYPVSTLWRPHIVNDHLGRMPVLISYCFKCFSGTVFDPQVEGQRLDFELYGRYMGALAMKDDQTGTLWAHLSGEVLAGPLVGRQLDMLPVETTTLASWLDRYPDSTTPDPAVMDDPSPISPGTPLSGGGGGRVPRRDTRMKAEAMVLGVTLGGRSRAYALDPDNPGPRLSQDVLAGIPIALLAPAGAWPLTYDRRTRAGVVTLAANGEELVDSTGSTWTARGQAVDGPLAGTSLEPVPSRMVEWWAWAAYYPDTDIVYPQREVERSGSVPPGVGGLDSPW